MPSSRKHPSLDRDGFQVRQAYSIFIIINRKQNVLQEHIADLDKKENMSNQRQEKEMTLTSHSLVCNPSEPDSTPIIPDEHESPLVITRFLVSIGNTLPPNLKATLVLVVHGRSYPPIPSGLDPGICL